MHSLVACVLLLASWVSVAGSLSCSQLSNTYLQLFPDPSPFHAPSPDNVKPNVYFLHIPRTAGRTLNMCLLSAATPPSQRCLKYEQLKAQDGMQHCALLTSHDDYSAMQLLRPGTAVITQLRQGLGSGAAAAYADTQSHVVYTPHQRNSQGSSAAAATFHTPHCLPNQPGRPRMPEPCPPHSHVHCSAPLLHSPSPLTARVCSGTQWTGSCQHMSLQ